MATGVSVGIPLGTPSRSSVSSLQLQVALGRESAFNWQFKLTRNLNVLVSVLAVHVNEAARDLRAALQRRAGLRRHDAFTIGKIHRIHLQDATRHRSSCSDRLKVQDRTGDELSCYGAVQRKSRRALWPTAAHSRLLERRW